MSLQCCPLPCRILPWLSPNSRSSWCSWWRDQYVSQGQQRRDQRGRQRRQQRRDQQGRQWGWRDRWRCANANATDGAAPDRSSATDTTDCAVAMTPTELCQTAIRLQVESLSVCQGGSQEERFALANLCPNSYFNADSNRAVASVAAWSLPTNS